MSDIAPSPSKSDLLLDAILRLREDHPTIVEFHSPTGETLLGDLTGFQITRTGCALRVDVEEGSGYADYSVEAADIESLQFA